MHYVYVLYSATRKRYYIGSTSDLQKRFSQHNSSRRGFTSVGQPWTLVYSEEYATKTEALKREYYFKKTKSTRFIEGLLNTGTNTLDA